MAVLYDHVLAVFDTEAQPTGKVVIGYEGGQSGSVWPPRPPIPPHPVPHPEMKKHHHELHLIINGPDGSDVTHCVQTAVTAAQVTALVAAVAAGAGWDAVKQSIEDSLQACLGQGFAANVEDHDSWPTWLV
jgi:hypothetical protein